jgi:hypothetical protein
MILLPAGAARAEGPGDEKLRSVLASVREKHDVPGLWAGRFHADGRRLFAVSGVFLLIETVCVLAADECPRKSEPWIPGIQ